VVAWDRVFDDIDATDIVNPAVLPIVERLADSCVATGPESARAAHRRRAAAAGLPRLPDLADRAMASRIVENTPGAEPIDVPLLIVQSTVDACGPAGPGPVRSGRRSAVSLVRVGRAR
jgi:hypothetical protein